MLTDAFVRIKSRHDWSAPSIDSRAGNALVRLHKAVHSLVRITAARCLERRRGHVHLPRRDAIARAGWDMPRRLRFAVRDRRGVELLGLQHS